MARIGRGCGVWKRHRFRVALGQLGERVAGGIGVEVDVELLQACVRDAGLGDLGRVRRIGVGKTDDVLTIDVAPGSVEVVEAVVFLVDDDKMLVVAQRPIVGRGCGPRRHQADGKQGKRYKDGAQPSAPVRHGLLLRAQEWIAKPYRKRERHSSSIDEAPCLCGDLRFSS